MKLLSLLLVSMMFFSCGKIQKIMDGTAGLPEQIDMTNEGMKKSNENMRELKKKENLTALQEPANRANLIPLPFNMMPFARSLASVLTADEAVLFFKNYLIKIDTQQSVDSVPVVDEEVFQHNRIADYYMLQLVAGYLPENTIKAIIKNEAEQGAYQEILMAILKLRVDFNSDMMVMIAMLGVSPNEVDDKGQPKVVKPSIKLNTLGKIEQAMLYNTEVEKVCNLEFANKIGLSLENFPTAAFDKERAKKNWRLILARAESDYKAQSLMADPKENEKQVEIYAKKYQDLLAQLKQKAQ